MTTTTPYRTRRRRQIDHALTTATRTATLLGAAAIAGITAGLIADALDLPEPWPTIAAAGAGITVAAIAHHHRQA